MITVHKRSNGRTTDQWVLTHNGAIYNVTTEHSRNRDTLTTLRYLINRTLKVNTEDYIFLGNRRVEGIWITEWMLKNDNCNYRGPTRRKPHASD